MRTLDLSPWWFYLLSIPVLAGSLLVGPSGEVTLSSVTGGLYASLTGGLSPDAPESLSMTILVDVRLPRVLLAFLVGAALTVSGTALQALVRNPLVSPDILGLSSGAAFGAALALTSSWLPIQPTAFGFGLLAAILTYSLARRGAAVSMLWLVLAGVVVSGVFTALLTLVQIGNDPFRLQSIVQWTMGNLHHASWSKVRSAAPLIVASCAGLLLMRWRLNVLALGDLEARSVGVNTERERVLVLAPAALVASAAVAVAGVVAMVGLAVPHMARLLVGPDNRRLMPVSIAFGGCFLVLVDDLARSLATYEIPIGVFTVLIGGPFFIYLLRASGASHGE